MSGTLILSADKTTSPEEVTLIIPCLAEYVGVARLAILGVANRLSFSYDEVEDIRLAVGEACGQSIERATEYRSLLETQEQPVPTLPLKITASISESTLTVEVIDAVPPLVERSDDTSTGLDGIDYQKLGSVLIEILVDDVSVTETDSGTTVKLIKTIGLTT